MDERAEYLRRTCHSLRAGRRNLHSRICQYLRSPRGAKFNHEAVLKQEEALAELDASIDDWVNKLEHAENRRTRIRQKLLEHVAAAMTLPVSGADGIGESLKTALGITPPSGPTDISTPPRSPIKVSSTPRATSASPPPHRAVAQVPSTILEQPIIEEDTVCGQVIKQTEGQQEAAHANDQAAEDILTADIRRAAVESIRIYAGDEVAALLFDVEQQINRMSHVADRAKATKENGTMSKEERRELNRACSHEVLQGGLKTTSPTASLHITANTSATAEPSALTSTPSASASVAAETKEEAPGELLLTSAVFNPKTAIAR